MSTPPQDAGVSRRALLATGGGVAAALVIPVGEADAAAPHPIGKPPDGASLAEVVGHLDQNIDAMTGFGYLTRIRGLRDADVFAGKRDESGARFTFSAKATVHERFLRGSMIAASATGTISFYLGGGGGDFDNPGSFSDGVRIARFRARFQNVLSLVANQQAVTTVDGELVQTLARVFHVGGRKYRFGKRGLHLHLSVNGPGRKTDPVVRLASFDVAGHLSAT
jgi:hypothetical protein